MHDRSSVKAFQQSTRLDLEPTSPANPLATRAPTGGRAGGTRAAAREEIVRMRRKFRKRAIVFDFVSGRREGMGV